MDLALHARRKKLSKREIFKIQRSLARSRVLVYNRDRTLWHEDDTSEDLEALFPAGEMKIYHWGKLNVKTGKIDIAEAAPEQDW